jgi:hypothetical protein
MLKLKKTKLIAAPCVRKLPKPYNENGITNLLGEGESKTL